MRLLKKKRLFVKITKDKKREENYFDRRVGEAIRKRKFKTDATGREFRNFERARNVLSDDVVRELATDFGYNTARHCELGK